MKAVVLRQFGDPSQLRVEDVPTPEPRGDEVLVKIRAASINPSDVKNVEGKMHGTTLPRIPGRDFAGVVVGGVAGLIGKEVWGTGGDIGFTRDGSHTEYILLPSAAVAMKPAALSMEQAGAAGLTFVTAWSALVSAARVVPSDMVVIIGAAGGVGSAAVQIAKSRGARVVALARSDKDLPAIRANGADEAVNSESSFMTEAVRGATVVLDTSGMKFPECIDMAGIGGRIPVITAPPDGKAAINLRDVYRKILRIDGVDTRAMDAVACARSLAEMLPDFESGKFKSAMAKSVPFSDAVDGYKRSAAGERIVLSM